MNMCTRAGRGPPPSSASLSPRRGGSAFAASTPRLLAASISSRSQSVSATTVALRGSPVSSENVEPCSQHSSSHVSGY